MSQRTTSCVPGAIYRDWHRAWVVASGLRRRKVGSAAGWYGGLAQIARGGDYKPTARRGWRAWLSPEAESGPAFRWASAPQHGCSEAACCYKFSVKKSLGRHTGSWRLLAYLVEFGILLSLGAHPTSSISAISWLE